jgi:hypothetical protein
MYTKYFGKNQGSGSGSGYGKKDWRIATKMGVPEKKGPPQSFGQKWSEEEELQLIKEIHDNFTMEHIAEMHNRTVGGITSRIKEIVYKMYVKRVPLDEIMAIAKITETELNDIIEMKNPITETDKIIIEYIDNLKSSVSEVQFDISILKEQMLIMNTNIEKIYTFLETMVYESEDVEVVDGEPDADDSQKKVS